MDNLKFGIDAVTAAGGIAEGTICYTGDLTDPKRTKVWGGRRGAAKGRSVCRRTPLTHREPPRYTNAPSTYA